MVGKRRIGTASPQTGEYIALPDQAMELVLRDPHTGAEVRLGVTASLRDLEVLGSAGLHYAEEYTNPLRPAHQVGRRRQRAARLGEALWQAAVERCGIEEPS